MRTGHLIVALCAGLALLGCAGPAAGPAAETAKPAVPVEKNGVITLEIEDFPTLKDAKAMPLTGAGGGKAVLFDKETSLATTTVNLKKGTYEVTLYIQAVDPDHDAVLLSINGSENRLFTNDYGNVVPASDPFTFEMAADGPCVIQLKPAELDVQLDRVELKRTK
jgi:hypothetical protein